MIRVDLASEEFRADPYAVYRRLRREAPVHCQEERGQRFWLLTRYADVVRVLRDPRASVDRPFQPRPPPPSDADPATLHPTARALRALSRVMLFRDPPDHTHLRGLVAKAFTPRTVEKLRPRIQTLVDELLDARAGDGGMDAIADLAFPLPVLVIAELLGLPLADYKQLKTWSDDLAMMLDGTIALAFLPRAVKSAGELVDYLRGIVAQRRRDPRDDLLSALLASEESGDELDEDEILGTSILLLGAGHETTTNLIGNGLLALLRHPEERQRLQRSPELVASAVEECLRWDSPVQATSRILPEPLEIGGRTIPAGEEIGLFLAAANRDPEQFEDAERFDVTRAENRHLSFGHGIHFCIGAGLARAEAQLALASVLRRMPGLALASEALHWRPGFLFRGVESLPVRF